MMLIIETIYTTPALIVTKLQIHLTIILWSHDEELDHDSLSELSMQVAHTHSLAIRTHWGSWKFNMRSLALVASYSDFFSIYNVGVESVIVVAAINEFP